ncbi:hypothetical protein [Mucilaginibacter sp.]
MEQETNQIPINVLFAGVTQQQLDEWKAEHKEIHVITVKLNEHELLTGYFKKPCRNIATTCIAMFNDNKTHEASEFLLNNTFIGGDKQITTNQHASLSAQTKLWTSVNFLTAEVTKY